MDSYHLLKRDKGGTKIEILIYGFYRFIVLNVSILFWGSCSYLGISFNFIGHCFTILAGRCLLACRRLHGNIGGYLSLLGWTC